MNEQNHLLLHHEDRTTLNILLSILLVLLVLLLCPTMPWIMLYHTLMVSKPLLPITEIFFLIGSTPSMEPSTGLELTTLRSRTEQRPRVGHLTDWAPQTPLTEILYMCLFFLPSLFPFFLPPIFLSLSLQTEWLTPGSPANSPWGRSYTNPIPKKNEGEWTLWGTNKKLTRLSWWGSEVDCSLMLGAPGGDGATVCSKSQSWTGERVNSFSLNSFPSPVSLWSVCPAGC